MVNASDTKLAKRLALLVVEAGEAGPRELKPALEAILANRSIADQRGFLKAFHKAVVREIHRDTLTIESASALSQDIIAQLAASFGEGHSRALQLVQKTNPALIAGLRVRLGDTVYDASLAHNLQILASRIR